MKKLSVTPVTNSAQFFPKKGTLEFLQLAFREGFDELIKSLIGPAYNPATVYVLRGVINTGTYPNYIISEGCVFYGGEFYILDAASFTATGTDVAVFSIVQSQYTTYADPVTLSDLTTHNIHNILKMRLSAGAPGSGLANILQAYYMNFVIPSQLNLSAPASGVYADNTLQLIGAYPDMILYVPTPATNNYRNLITGTVNIGDCPGGSGGSIAVVFASTLPTADYTVLGSIRSNGGDETANCTVLWTARGRTTGGFTLQLREFSSFIQNVSFDYVIVSNT